LSSTPIEGEVMVPTVLRSLLLVSLLLSAGPVLAQSYTRASLLKFIDDATAGLGQANKVYKDHQSLLDDVLAQTTTRHAVPYPFMGQKVREMGTRVRSIKVNQGILAGKRSQVDLIFGADEEVFTEDRRWKDVRTMVRTLQLRADLINGDWEVMKILDKEFTEAVRKNGIKSRPASDYVNKINSMKEDHWKKVDDARDKMKNVRQWAKKGDCDAAVADNLSSLQKEVDASWGPYKAEADRLRDSFKGKAWVFQGPGVPKVTVLEQFDAAGKGLREKKGAFTKEYKSLEAQVKASRKEKKKR